MKQEQRENRQIQPIGEDEVMRTFTRLQNGYLGQPTPQQQRVAYARFINTIALYFSQPITRREPTDESGQLMNDLFLKPDDNPLAQVQIAFCQDVRKRLIHEIPGTRPHAWTDRAKLIADLAKQELLAIIPTLEAERQATTRLETLAASRRKETNHQEETSEASLLHRQNAVIGVMLTVDEDLSRFATNIQGQTTLALELLDGGQVLTDQNVSLLPTRARMLLGLPLAKRQLYEEEIRIALLTAQEPVAIWEQAKRGRTENDQPLVNPDLANALDHLLTLSQLQETFQGFFHSEIGPRGKIRTVSISAEEKAALLLPFLQKGIDASMLLSILEGKTDLPLDLIAKQIDAILHADEKTEQAEQTPQQREMRINQRLKTILLVSTIVVATGAVIYLAHNLHFSLDNLPWNHPNHSLSTPTPTPTPSPTPTTNPGGSTGTGMGGTPTPGPGSSTQPPPTPTPFPSTPGPDNNNVGTGDGTTDYTGFWRVIAAVGLTELSLYATALLQRGRHTKQSEQLMTELEQTAMEYTGQDNVFAEVLKRRRQRAIWRASSEEFDGNDFIPFFLAAKLVRNFRHEHQLRQLSHTLADVSPVTEPNSVAFGEILGETADDAQWDIQREQSDLALESMETLISGSVEGMVGRIFKPRLLDHRSEEFTTRYAKAVQPIIRSLRLTENTNVDELRAQISERLYDTFLTTLRRFRSRPLGPGVRLIAQEEERVREFISTRLIDSIIALELWRATAEDTFDQTY